MTRFVRFASTIWTVIHEAGRKRNSAYGELIHLYREPVTRYLVARGVDEASAEDLAQEVFLRLFEKDLLSKLEQSKGKFRSYLLGVTNNILREHAEHGRAKKRGGDLVRVPLESVDHVPSRDRKDFTREWMLHLVRLALTRMARTGSEAARRDLEIFRAFLWDRQPYETLAGRFGTTFHAVKNAIHETKKRIRQEVAGLINKYTYTQSEFRAELTAFDRQGLKAGGR